MKVAKNVWLSLFSLFINTQFGAGQDAAVISDNIKKFSEIYGFATQIMNLGGSFMGGGGNGNAQPSTFSGNTLYGGNSRANKFDGFMGYKPMASILDNKGYGLQGSNNEYLPSGFGRTTEYGGGEYDYGPLGAANSRSQPKSIIESLMGSFLGSSVDNGAGSLSSSNPYSSVWEGGSGSQTRGGSDIESIVQALTRSGAKKAEMTETDSPASFLSQFFGRRK